MFCEFGGNCNYVAASSLASDTAIRGIFQYNTVFWIFMNLSGTFKENIRVWFAIFGSNVNIDDDGNVTSVLDAKTVLKAYRALCELEGKSADKVIVMGE